ncbi:MAG: Mrp/NBP35 family ATP-binding protein [Clostridia bacterium]|nr:Mrp/NBP35 family ATP-binding protein [Clostridia bacterium]MBQ6183638.1 Mrp/NBP35 family ATP-binding protein [Clostridia bacterium]
MSECTHDCSTCSANCASRTQKPESLIEKPNENSIIRNVIAVVSGKGGVGKSLVTSLLAVNTQRRDYRTAILDADLTGPSIPKAFGLKERLEGSEQGILPAVTRTGIQVVSLNLLLENETDPVVWRGPVIAGTVKQFWTDVVWNDVDYMYVDMPPGTGDVPLTVFQSIPVKGIVIVTSPQELVSMIVEKAVNMAKLMNIPVLGIVENLSYYECPDCHSRHFLFGESRLEEVAAQYGIPVIARIPIEPKLSAATDKGAIELFEGDWLDGLTDAIAGK